ncbi:hypothetical protein IUJ34_08190 [Klebsiella pneumoniae subsp. pneumoniae]|uniref:Uncharacterized protein n=1 Tax=Klebsiella pneumoniae subsp. pneumoniae TaxID=72407 RepID=A0A7S9HF96_KLEPN|nr:hypothetical protein IUJ34_08190 [Klebsiella pneumoniae subsp. pneumoniae]
MKANNHEQSRHADPQRAPADARRCAGAFNPFTAGAAPAFLITPNSKPSNLRRKKNDAASAKQTQESRQSADNKNRYQHLTITKRITSQQAAIAQKDKLIQQLKTACRYAANGYCRSE